MNSLLKVLSIKKESSLILPKSVYKYGRTWNTNQKELQLFLQYSERQIRNRKNLIYRIVHCFRKEV